MGNSVTKTWGQRERKRRLWGSSGGAEGEEGESQTPHWSLSWPGSLLTSSLETRGGITRKEVLLPWLSALTRKDGCQRCFENRVTSPSLFRTFPAFVLKSPELWKAPQWLVALESFGIWCGASGSGPCRKWWSLGLSISSKEEQWELVRKVYFSQEIYFSLISDWIPGFLDPEKGQSCHS